MLHWLSPNRNDGWFSLDDIVQSALADVIHADAHFQLTQGAAWQQFGDSLRELSDNPLLKTLDVSVGFGRLENLAINELTVQLPLDVYRPSWLRRRWWGVLKVFGGETPSGERQYRLSRAAPGAANRIELAIKVSRDANGRWRVNPEEEADHG